VWEYFPLPFVYILRLGDLKAAMQARVAGKLSLLQNSSFLVLSSFCAVKALKSQ